VGRGRGRCAALKVRAPRAASGRCMLPCRVTGRLPAGHCGLSAPSSGRARPHSLPPAGNMMCAEVLLRRGVLPGG
jgi:hypothetical protein